MAWPTITKTLAAFHAANGETTPVDPNADELAQIDLQTRDWLYGYLSTVFESAANTLKAAAVVEATLAGKVLGSGDNDVAAATKSIVHGSVSTPDLKDLAVTAAKIADATITAAKIASATITDTQMAANSVTATQIAANAVTSTKIMDNAVTAAKILADAVTTAKILDANVTAAKIASNVIGGNQLIVGTGEGQILVAGANPYKFAVKAISGAATLDKDGVLTLANYGTCVLEEQGSAGTSGGSSLACAASWATTNVRGAAVSWVESWTTLASSFVTIEGGSTGHFNLAAGTYIIEATAPAYKVGKHIARLLRYNSEDVLQDTFYGSSANTAAADAITTESKVFASFTCAATDYFVFEHWTESIQATNGLGLAVNAGGTGMHETFAQIKIQKLS